MSEKQGALRAAIGLFRFVIWCILDAKPGKDACNDQIPDQNDECHGDPQVTAKQTNEAKINP